MRNPKFLGVYSLKAAPAKGPKPRYFVWELPNDSYAVQELDPALTQRGPARGVTAAALAKAFKAEPSILAAPVTTPDFRRIMEANAPSSAASPSNEAGAGPALDHGKIETELRNHFRRAMGSLKNPKERDGALTLLNRIVRVQKGIEPVHKHMFRDFGVALRKQSLLELALVAAQRAVALSPQDDHARFNLARILGLLGQFQEAQAQIDAARKLAPAEAVYARLAAWLQREQVRGGQK